MASKILGCMFLGVSVAVSMNSLDFWANASDLEDSVVVDRANDDNGDQREYSQAYGYGAAEGVAIDYSENAGIPIQQLCRDACQAAFRAMADSIQAIFQARKSEIESFRISALNDAKAIRDAVINDPNSSQQEIISALLTYQNAEAAILAYVQAQFASLARSTQAAYDQNLRNVELCYNACGFLPPEVEIPW